MRRELSAAYKYPHFRPTQLSPVSSHLQFQDDFIGGADVDISTILNASDGQEVQITKILKNIGGFSAGDLRFTVCAKDGTLTVTALGATELCNPDAVTKV